MQQANPDAGDARGSDSDGKGIWVGRRGRVHGKWVEFMANRETHRFTGRGEYTFEITVSGDHLLGNGTMQVFDENSRPIGAIATTFTVDRLTLSP